MLEVVREGEPQHEVHMTEENVDWYKNDKKYQKTKDSVNAVHYMQTEDLKKKMEWKNDV